MRMNKREFSFHLAGLAALSAWGGVGAATAAPAAATSSAAWPTKPVRLLVGFPGGSTPDLVARTLAEPLSHVLGQPVIVENKPGASGNIAADQVAKSTDGHTFGVLINGNMTIAKMLNPATPFDPLKDLAPISLVGTAPLALVGLNSAPADGKAFLAAAREAGDRWSYGSPGIGTVSHLGMELLKSKAGFKAVHVPYPGNPQVVNAMLAGQIHVALLPPALALAQMRAGKLRAIGLTSSGRSPLVPELPGLVEAGVDGVNLEVWDAVAAPAGQSPAVIARMAAALSDIVRSPEIRQKLFQQGWKAIGSSPEGLRLRVAADTELLGGVITRQRIRVE